MTTALDVLKIERSYVGKIKESPPGSNRTVFGQRYGFDGVPWCAIAQVECFEEANAEDLIPKTAYTPTMAQYYIDRKRFSREPRVGALVFYNFADSLDRIQHVGCLERIVSGSLLDVLEGNTSSGTSGSQDNGDGFYRRGRAFNSWIVGFGYPAWEKDLPRFDLPKAKLWFGRGDSGADVRRWQHDLNRWMAHIREHREDLTFDFGRIELGKFDGETARATLQFQKYYGLDVDARVGKHTIRKMEAVRTRQKNA